MDTNNTPNGKESGSNLEAGIVIGGAIVATAVAVAGVAGAIVLGGVAAPAIIIFKAFFGGGDGESDGGNTAS